MRQDNVAFALMASHRRLFSPVFQAWKLARALLIIRMPLGPPIICFFFSYAARSPEPILVFDVKDVALTDVYILSPTVVESLVRLPTKRFQEQVGPRVLSGRPQRFSPDNVPQATSQRSWA